MIARILDGSGRLALAQGAADLAVARHREGLSLARSAGVSFQVVNGLEGLAAAVYGQGHAERSVRLLGAVERMREARGIPLRPVERPGHDRLTQALRTALGEEAFAAIWTAGQAVSLEEAIALALEEPSRSVE